MDSYILFATKDANEPDTKPTAERGRVSDIIKMSQDISGGWLKKEAEKKVVVQEQIQQQKDKPQEKKPKKEEDK